jgi:prepilin-type N-terminal cleavage/methylation domain-containing protein
MLLVMELLGQSCDRKPRRAFTLVELLVVITLVLVLAALAVMFIPNMADQQRAAEAGAQVQGWLNIARQRALRDQAPRGIRFYPSSASAGICIEAQYIDQPDDFVSGMIQTSGNNSTIVFSGADSLSSVQPGDYLEVLGSGTAHQISAVNAATNTITLSSTLPFSGLSTTGAPTWISTPTSAYRIIRQPRVSGEEKLMLPANTGVDLSGTLSQFSGSTSSQLDILFTPSGNVIGAQAGQSQVILWVYDTTLSQKTANGGEPTLIVINVRSGMIAAVPVNPSGGFATPYSFASAP